MQYQDPSAEAFMDSVRRIVQELRVYSRESETKLGLSAAQIYVLQSLEADGGVSINELAVRTLTHQSSVSVVVRRLVSGGLVSRAPSADDRRRLEIRLTARGRSVLRRIGRAPQVRLSEAVLDLKPADRKALARLLVRVLGSAGLSRKPAPMFFEEGRARG